MQTITVDDEVYDRLDELRDVMHMDWTGYLDLLVGLGEDMMDRIDQFHAEEREVTQILDSEEFAQIFDGYYEDDDDE